MSGGKYRLTNAVEISIDFVIGETQHTIAIGDDAARNLPPLPRERGRVGEGRAALLRIADYER